MKPALVCSVCGYVHLQDNAPEKCPICGANSKNFDLKEDALQTKDDIVAIGETHKKHLPEVSINQVQIWQEKFTEIKAQIGQISHPMTQQHLIKRIIFYADNNYMAHLSLSENMKSFGAILTDVNNKKISVVAQCNVHGSWITNL